MVKLKSSGCGGTGRHARLRGVWLTPCEFESRHPHKLLSALRRELPLSPISRDGYLAIKIYRVTLSGGLGLTRFS